MQLHREVVALTVIAVALGAAVAGDDLDVAKAKAKAALMLATKQQKIEKVIAQSRDVTVCHVDAEKAAAVARKAKMPLVLWVGMKCEDKPELRKALGDAVHCHVTERPGIAAASVVIKGGDDIEYFVPKDKIDATTADKIKAKWNLKRTEAVSPPAKVREEISYAYPVYGGPVWYSGGYVNARGQTCVTV